jgi:hypothetical protein
MVLPEYGYYFYEVHKVGVFFNELCVFGSQEITWTLMRTIRCLFELNIFSIFARDSVYRRVFWQSQKETPKQPIWIGVSSRGVLVAERRGDSVLVVAESFQWQNIQKISFKQHRFSIRPKSSSSTGSEDADTMKLNYYTESYKKYAPLSFVSWFKQIRRER